MPGSSPAQRLAPAPPPLAVSVARQPQRSCTAPAPALLAGVKTESASRELTGACAGLAQVAVELPDEHHVARQSLWGAGVVVAVDLPDQDPVAGGSVRIMSGVHSSEWGSHLFWVRRSFTASKFCSQLLASAAISAHLGSEEGVRMQEEDACCEQLSCSSCSQFKWERLASCRSLPREASDTSSLLKLALQPPRCRAGARARLQARARLPRLPVVLSTCSLAARTAGLVRARSHCLLDCRPACLPRIPLHSNL